MSNISCNGARLYYEDEGDGTPIVFLHGVLMGSRFFTKQISELKDDFRIIAIDFRGHGRSEKTETGHTVPQYAADLNTFLKHLSIEDFVLVGWSMGALVGWDYISQFGTDKLKGFVDVDQHPSDYKWSDYNHGLFNLQELIDTMELIQTDPDKLADSLIEHMLKEPPSEEIKSMMFDEISRVPPSIKSAILFDQTIRDYREILLKVDVPTLVCLGEDEKFVPPDGVEYAAEHMPNSELIRFENSGHCPFIEEFSRFNRVLKDFIKRL